MPSDSTDSRRKVTAKNHHMALGAPPRQEPEHLPCPRCDSTNTKFCYYNNYNFSQPRHFCKSCRRYWTHGGTLRDIPVGGGSRKTAKRSRGSTATSRNVSPVSSGLDYHRHFSSVATTPLLLPFSGDHVRGPQCGSFTSLLSNSQNSGIYGLGVGGFDQDLSFGLGRTIWPFSGTGDGVVAGHAGVGGGGGVNTWQLESGGDCFVLPDLAISRRGNAMKLK